MLKFLIIWDIFWRTGRRVVKKYLPGLKEKYSPDFIIWNSENMTSGRGPALKHILEMKELWFDCLTGWNHTFANLKDIRDYLEQDDCIQIRACNYYEHPRYKVPGKWYKIVEKNWNKILVISLMSVGGYKLFNPFIRIDEVLKETWLDYDAIIIDFHRDYTGEAYIMAEYLNWRVALMYGTHTHVQTNDEHILSWWTGMITDIGMAGSFHSSIWQKFDGRMQMFVTGLNIFGPKPEQDIGLWLLNGLYIEIENNKCLKIEKIKIIEEET